MFPSTSAAPPSPASRELRRRPARALRSGAGPVKVHEPYQMLGWIDEDLPRPSASTSRALRPRDDVRFPERGLEAVAHGQRPGSARAGALQGDEGPRRHADLPRGRHLGARRGHMPKTAISSTPSCVRSRSTRTGSTPPTTARNSGRSRPTTSTTSAARAARDAARAGPSSPFRRHRPSATSPSCRRRSSSTRRASGTSANGISRP